MKIERMTLEVNKAQHAESSEGPLFSQLKLKKPSQKQKQEITTVTLPKFQLKSRIKYVNDWPPEDTKPSITFLGSIKQNGELSRNIKEAAKIKKKPLKLKEIPDLEKVPLEEVEKFEMIPGKPNTVSLEELQPAQAEVEEVKTPIKTTKKKISEKPIEVEDVIPEKKILKKTDDVPDEIHHITEKTLKIEDDTEEKPTVIQDDVIKSQPNIENHLEEKPNRDIQIEEKPIKEDKEEKPENNIAEETMEKEKLRKPIKQKSKPKTEVKPAPTSEDTVKEEPLELKKDETPLEKPKEELKITEAPENIDEPTKKPTEKKPKKIKKKEMKIDQPESAAPEEPLNEEPEQTIAEIPKEIKPSEPIERKVTKPKKEKHVLIESKDEPAEEFETEKKPIEPSLEPKKKLKLTPMKIERKTLQVSAAQHAENVESPQFTKLKLKKTVTAPKRDSVSSSLPKFQLKSRITHVRDWPPEIIKPVISYLGSVRQNGILSRNVKEAAKIKKKVYKQPDLPDIEKTELEKPMFGHEDIIEIQKVKVDETDKPEDDIYDEEPEQVTFKPKRPSIIKTEEIVDEITIKKKLKPLRKSSITLPEITEPENVTFRPKTTKTKEDVEQEFSIQLDSYAEEEISMSSKVKLKPQRHPTFNEEANEASIKFYTEGEDDDGPEIVEIEGSDLEDEEMPNVMMRLKKPQTKKVVSEEIEDSTVTVFKPKQKDQISEVTQDINITLDRKPKYVTEDQEEVSFDVKAQKEQYTQEELSLSSKIKLKPKKKVTMYEAADEASIKITKEIEDNSQQEEIILSEAESDDNIEMFIKRKPKKPAYEVSEIEELSVELKPSRKKEETYEEEQLTILAKRKPRKPSQIQGKY